MDSIAPSIYGFLPFACTPAYSKASASLPGQIFSHTLYRPPVQSCAAYCGQDLWRLYAHDNKQWRSPGHALPASEGRIRDSTVDCRRPRHIPCRNERTGRLSPVCGRPPCAYGVYTADPAPVCALPGSPDSNTPWGRPGRRPHIVYRRGPVSYALLY